MTRSPEPAPAVSPALTAAFGPMVETADMKREIRSGLFAIARVCGWKPGEIHWRDRPMTYHWVDMERTEVRWTILIGADARLLALSRGTGGEPTMDFTDNEEFSRAAAEHLPGFKVLRADDLLRDLSDADRAFLRQQPGMTYNLTYWRPRTVGDVVFNWWD